MAESEHEIAHQTQEKFHFYAVALIFTILGLSIQTASFEAHVVSRILELLGWLLLLVSGFCALSHIEWHPVLRVKMARRDELSHNAEHLKSQKELGAMHAHVRQHDKVVPIDERINEYDQHLEKLDALIDDLDKGAEIKYQISKWGFVLGIISIVCARAVGPVTSIINELGR